jgi:hypothetical protein
MTYSDYKELTFERRENGVLLITLNRPEKHNAADEGMHREIARVWKDVSTDPETWVAMVTGAGKAFARPVSPPRSSPSPERYRSPEKREANFRPVPEAHMSVYLRTVTSGHSISGARWRTSWEK